MKRMLLVGALTMSLWACGTKDEVSVPEGQFAIPDGFGKSDNYIGTSAQEFILSGSATSALPEGFADLDEEPQREALDAAVTRRTTDITRAAQRHIDAVLREANARRLQENPLPEPEPDAGTPEDPYQDYFIYVKPSQQGGMALNVDVVNGMAQFDFELEIVASLELIGLVATDGEAFDLQIPAASGDGEETVRIAVTPSPSTDAFPRYDEMFADGVYDIGLIFGGDYNSERYDLETAKWTVSFLLEEGWSHPTVTAFEQLRHDSGPFTRTLRVEGTEIEARVYIVHAQMDDDAGAEQTLLRDLAIAQMAERDVVIYSGHAGANAGMLLDYHPRYELDDDEFKDVTTRDGYQIYVFDGCNSYRTYVDALMANPARTFDTTNVVTTVNTTPFSAGYEIINRFVHWLTFTVDDGSHLPISWNTLLRGVNDTYLDVHYGVHGVDNNPKLNPHGGQDAMCQSCQTSSDCGSGANFCLNYGGGAACGVACTDDAACGDGYQCISVDDDPELFYLPRQCVRTNLTCG